MKPAYYAIEEREGPSWKEIKVIYDLFSAKHFLSYWRKSAPIGTKLRLVAWTKTRIRVGKKK